MAKSGKETIALLFTLLITGGVAGGGMWLLLKNPYNGIPGVGNPNPNSSTSPSTNTNATAVDSRLSGGNKILIASISNPSKQAGVQAIATSNWQTAVTQLEASLRSERNDPEALIYLNNARIGNAKNLKIAVSVPIGGNENVAKEILRGVAQAQDEVNRSGGINGVPVQVLIADDSNDPAIAQQVAQVLVANPEVLGVVGNFGSDVTLAAGKVYQAGQLVLISPTSTSVQLSGFGNYIFRTVPSDRFAANSLSRYTLNQLKKKKAVIFFNSTSTYSKSLKDEFTTAVFGDGGQVVAEFDLSSSSFDAVQGLQQANTRGAEVIMLASNAATLDRALQVVAVNRKQLPLVGGDSLYTAKTLQVGGDNASGMVLAVPWHLLANPNAAFPKQAASLWGADVNWRTAMAYDATQAILAGLKQDPTRAGLQKALADPGFAANGSAGKIQFQPSGDRNSPAILVKVAPGKRSGIGYDFVLP
jgi:branched-chain amino acid transport system substrate-binding protein